MRGPAEMGGCCAHREGTWGARGSFLRFQGDACAGLGRVVVLGVSGLVAVGGAFGAARNGVA